MSKNLIRNIIVGLVLSLLIFGSSMVLTSTSEFSLTKTNDFMVLFNKHISMVIFSLLAFGVGFGINYNDYKRRSKVLALIIILLLASTYIFGIEAKGASRWLPLFGPISFQPSELAKIFIVLHVSYLIVRLDERIKSFKNGIIFPLIWIGLISAMIMFQPNFSTALIIGFVGLSLLYVGGARKRHLLSIVVSAGTAVGVLMMFFSHTKNRLLAFINTFSDTTAELNYQVTQAHIALGSGGLWGLGAGHSKQANLFVSEAYGDFIFSIIGEEWGFFGTITIASVFISLFIFSLLLINKVEDEYGKLIIFGLSFNLVITALINMAVVLGIFPTTGITLPFISYGGTSLAIYAFSIGVIMNITSDRRPDLIKVLRERIAFK